MIKPYYENNGITIYNADCKLILPHISADLLLTDPPYGIGAARKKGFGSGVKMHKTGLLKGKATTRRDYGDSTWDDEPVSDWLLTWLRQITTYQIIWGGNYFGLPPSPSWLVWDKMRGDTDFADAELAWTNLNRTVRRIQHKWNGFLQEKGHKEQRYHPTQKPLRVMQWCIEQVHQPFNTILDPFAGSGTTLLAARLANKNAIGIEAEQKYCEIAAHRLDALDTDKPITINNSTPETFFQFDDIAESMSLNTTD